MGNIMHCSNVVLNNESIIISNFVNIYYYNPYVVVCIIIRMLVLL